MNKKLDFIFSRRSIRKFQNKKVEAELVQDILQAAAAVPSAMCRDPWRFLVIENSETLQKLSTIMPNGSFMTEAPMMIMMLGDIKEAHIESESYMLQDCSASIENILLAINALGLGGCWCVIHPRSERVAGVRELFNLPENIIPIGGIVLGYPAESKEPRTRFDASKVHYEKW